MRKYTGFYYVAVGGQHVLVECEDGEWYRPDSLPAFLKAVRAQGKRPQRLVAAPPDLREALSIAYRKHGDREAAFASFRAA